MLSWASTRPGPTPLGVTGDVRAKLLVIEPRAGAIVKKSGSSATFSAPTSMLWSEPGVKPDWVVEASPS